MSDVLRRNSRPALLLRITVYSEIVVVAATVALAAGVYGMIPLGTVVLQLLSPLVLVGLVMWFVVPFVLISLSDAKRLAAWQRLAAIALAVMLFVTHAFALLAVLTVLER